MVLSFIGSFGYQVRGRFWGGNENENWGVRGIRVLTILHLAFLDQL